MNVQPPTSRESPHKVASRTFHNFLRLHAVAISLFFSLWFIYGLAVNSRNQYEFNLQQAGVEALVERHHFYLEGSLTPRFQMRVYYYDGGKPFGDIFERNGHQYAAKQPGQFYAGAVAYFVLHLFGFNYTRHYTLTSALVSFLTTSLITALAAVAVFGIVREFTQSGFGWPLGCALIYGLGTTAFVYSGFAYHDSLATGYLVIAFYLAILLGGDRLSSRTTKICAVGCGLLLGWTVTTSMLPFLMTCVVGLYVVSLRKWNLTLLLLAGGIAGISPLLIFNAVSFGNPFLNSYMAGGYPESMLRLNPANSLDKARLYLAEISVYVPIAWLGILGLAFFPRRIRREQIAIVVILVAQAFQILNIESHGGCHYGPRFLLPAMPFVSVGVCGFSYIGARWARVGAVLAVILLATISTFVSFFGATFTAMYCEVGVYGLWPAMGHLLGVGWNDFPLAFWLLAPATVSIAALAYFALSRARAETLA